MFGLGNPSASNTKIFYANTSVDNQGYQIWRKPPNISMVWFTILSGGGGGGGGGKSSTFCTGGGGGACSNITKFMCPAIFLPNELYIQVGKGGQGGAGGSGGAGAVNGTGGSSGINSYILTFPTYNAAPNIILYSGINAPGGGAGALNGSVGGGSVPSIPTKQAFNVMGIWSTTVGIAGAAGTSAAPFSTSITSWGSLPLSPGASGGYKTTTLGYNGGSINASTLTNLGTSGYYNILIAQGGITGSTTIDLNGSAGKKSMSPLINSGGAGGAGTTSSFGGNGGDGGWGCGGGGGSTGTTAGGRGGNGGDGLVIITWV